MAWLSGWNYRKSHVINSASGAGTNYQVKIICHYGSGTDYNNNTKSPPEGHVYLNEHCRTDFGDVRFTGKDASGNNPETNLLDCWMEEKVDGDYAVFWVELQYSLDSENQTIYVYYGKSDTTYPYLASDQAHGEATFLYFDNWKADHRSQWTGTLGNQRKYWTKSVDGGHNRRLMWKSKIVNWKVTTQYGPIQHVGFCNKDMTDGDTNPEHAIRISVYPDTDFGANNSTFAERLETRISDTDYLESVGNYAYSQNMKLKTDLKITSSKVAVKVEKDGSTVYSEESTNVPASANLQYLFFYLYWSPSGSYAFEWKDNEYLRRYTMRDSDKNWLDDYLDWMFLAKYVDPEPTHGSWGSEEVSTLSQSCEESLFLSLIFFKVPELRFKEKIESFEKIGWINKWKTLFELFSLFEMKSLSFLIFEQLNFAPSKTFLFERKLQKIFSLSDLVRKFKLVHLFESLFLSLLRSCKVKPFFFGSLSLSDLSLPGTLLRETINFLTTQIFGISPCLKELIGNWISPWLGRAKIILEPNQEVNNYILKLRVRKGFGENANYEIYDLNLGRTDLADTRFKLDFSFDFLKVFADKETSSYRDFYVQIPKLTNPTKINVFLGNLNASNPLLDTEIFTFFEGWDSYETGETSPNDWTPYCSGTYSKGEVKDEGYRNKAYCLRTESYMENDLKVASVWHSFPIDFSKLEKVRFVVKTNVDYARWDYSYGSCLVIFRALYSDDTFKALGYRVRSLKYPRDKYRKGSTNYDVDHVIDLGDLESWTICERKLKQDWVNAGFSTDNIQSFHIILSTTAMAGYYGGCTWKSITEIWADEIALWEVPDISITDTYSPTRRREILSKSTEKLREEIFTFSDLTEFGLFLSEVFYLLSQGYSLINKVCKTVLTFLDFFGGKAPFVFYETLKIGLFRISKMETRKEEAVSLSSQLFKAPLLFRSILESLLVLDYISKIGKKVSLESFKAIDSMFKRTFFRLYQLLNLEEVLSKEEIKTLFEIISLLESVERIWLVLKENFESLVLTSLIKKSSSKVLYEVSTFIPKGFSKIFKVVFETLTFVTKVTTFLILFFEKYFFETLILTLKHKMTLKRRLEEIIIFMISSYKKVISISKESSTLIDSLFLSRFLKFDQILKFTESSFSYLIKLLSEEIMMKMSLRRKMKLVLSKILSLFDKVKRKTPFLEINFQEEILLLSLLFTATTQKLFEVIHFISETMESIIFIRKFIAEILLQRYFSRIKKRKFSVKVK